MHNEQWQYSVEPVEIGHVDNILIWLASEIPPSEDEEVSCYLGVDAAGGQDPKKRHSKQIPKEVFDKLMATGLFKRWQ